MNDHDREKRLVPVIHDQAGAHCGAPSPRSHHHAASSGARNDGPASAAGGAAADRHGTPPRPRPFVRRRLRLALLPTLEKQRGFSLLELLVVVAILGILVAAALPRFAEFRAAAYDSRSQQDLRNLAAAEELYRATSPKYADDTTLLSGFAPSEGVQVSLESATETGFVATATHPAGSRDFRWDSSADPPLSSSAH